MKLFISIHRELHSFVKSPEADNKHLLFICFCQIRIELCPQIGHRYKRFRKKNQLKHCVEIECLYKIDNRILLFIFLFFSKLYSIHPSYQYNLWSTCHQAWNRFLFSWVAGYPTVTSVPLEQDSCICWHILHSHKSSSANSSSSLCLSFSHDGNNHKPTTKMTGIIAMIYITPLERDSFSTNSVGTIENL